MKKFFTKCLLLILLAFGGIHASYAQMEYGYFKITSAELTLDKPFITWKMHRTGGQASDPVVRYSYLYVGSASDANFNTYNGTPSYYYNHPLDQGTQILYADKWDNVGPETITRYNESYGVGIITREQDGTKYNQYVNFFPGANMGPAQMNRFFVRWTGWFNVNTATKKPYWIGVGPKTGVITAGDTYQGSVWKGSGVQASGNGVIEYKAITYNIPATAAATFTRKAGGKIEASISGNDHGSWNEYYGFGKGTGTDSYGYYSDNSYGTATLSGGKATYTLSGTFDETVTYTIYYHQFYKSSAIIEQHFQAGRKSAVVKGYMYPSSPQVTQDKWNKTVKLDWTINNNDSNHNTDGGWHIYRQKKGETGYTRLTSTALQKGISTYTDSSIETGCEYTYWITFVPTAYGNVTAPISSKLSCSTSIKHDNTFAFSKVNAELPEDVNKAGIDITWVPEKTGDGVVFFVQRWGIDPDTKQEGWLDMHEKALTEASFNDNQVVFGEDYKYRIKTTVWGTDFYSEEKTICYMRMTTVKEVTATKGTYTNMVKLNWDVNLLSEGNTRYVVSRKLLGDAQAVFTKIYEVVGSESSFYYEDISALPGQYYDYKVTAYGYLKAKNENEKDRWVEGNSRENDGFVQARGILTGRIKYGTGAAVQGAKVYIEKSDNDNTSKQFYSMYLNGNNAQGIQWNIIPEVIENYFTGNERPWTIQFYANPDPGMSGVQQIVDANGYAGVGVQPATGGYELMVKSATGTSAATYSATGIVIPAGKYSHIVFSYDGASTYTLRAIRLADENDNGIDFVEGQLLKTFTGKANVRFDDANRAGAITFGKSGFKGYIDEARVWTKVLTDKEVYDYHNRTLTCTEKNLLAYWPIDEGINGLYHVYDYSKTNGVANGSHAELLGGAVISEAVPTAEQLSLFGITDENGNYVIRGVPFSGDGTTYVVRPVLGIHKFSPSYHTRYVSSNSLAHDDITFEDVSSFPVSGVVYYENTTYPVQGCHLAVDGNVCSKEGKLIETDENGRFEISVPIGDHYITIEKNGHEFVGEGRYPTGIGTMYTFEAPISNLTFYDKTLVNLAGRVVGGDIEGNKPVGFGQSINNIGVTELVLTPTNDTYSLNVVKVESGTSFRYDNNSEQLAAESATDLIKSSSWRGANDQAGKIFIHTDAKTGEFSVMVPPLTYNVSAPIIVKNGKTVGDAGLIDVSNPNTNLKDTITAEDGTAMEFEYNTKYLATYHSDPVFTVVQDGFENGAFGTAELDITDQRGEFKVNIVNKQGAPVYNYGYPVFVQDNPYTFNLKGYEQYTNYDNDTEVTTTVPLKDCIVTIQNALSDGQAVLVEVEEDSEVTPGAVVELEANQIQLDDNGEATYTWKAGFPNITAPYSRTISMTYEIGGKVNSWIVDGKEFIEGVIIGSIPTGSNFVTSGPDKLLMVLRDPPGSGSSAEWSSGTVITKEKTIGHQWSSETSIKNKFNFGVSVKIYTGFGVSVATETTAKDEISGGAKVVTEGENATTISHSMTVTEAISTSDDPSMVGSMADVFVGYSSNLLFGKAREVNFRRDLDDNIALGLEDIIAVGSEFSTKFQYTAYYIENYLIPNLIEVRNSYLITVSEEEYDSYVNDTDDLIYITKLSKDDPRFGSNNSDKEVWGKDAAKSDATEGPSYKIVRPKRLTDNVPEKLSLFELLTKKEEVDQDMVHWANMQISNWTRHLAENEKEKIKSWEDRNGKVEIYEGGEYKSYARLLNNYSLDGGTSLTWTYETEDTRSESHEHETGAIALLGNSLGWELNKFGFETSIETETGGKRHKNTSTGETETASFSFTLAESGDDALSIDVYRSDSYSPMFRTRGGQTSAPYEDEEYTKYYEPGQHKLHEKTMQIEVPDIEVEVATVSNIASGSAASYTLLLTNKSEIDCDLYYKLLMMDETNPGGAQLSIDGVALSDNRVIKVPAGEVVRKTLLLKQSNLGVLDYENIGIVLASQEQGDPTGTFPQIADTVYISAHYVPSSSPVKMELNRTLLNTSSGANLDITFNSFDRNYYNLKAFRVQYMKQGDTDWTTLKEYLVNVEEGQQLSSMQAVLPEVADVTFTYDMSTFADGKYTFRVLSASTYGTGESTLVTDAIEVVKDMSRPMAFGTPKPTTGFLGMGDDIEITFNEDINNGRLTSTGNFIVTAALNGQQVAHDIALKATGSEGAVAKTEANINLIGKSFAVDMWVRISGEGTIFSHGNGTNKIALGIDDEFRFTVNGEAYGNPMPADKWIYLAFSLDQSQNVFTALYANDASSEYLAFEEPIEKYEGNGVVALGDGFTGAIHEVALWDEAIDVITLQSQMYETKMPTTEHLIGYWKLNEGLGTQAKDLARNRHMTLATTSWYLNNQNKALDLTNDALFGENDAVAIYLAECAARNGDDFAVEMWFCADKKQANAIAYLFDTDAFSVVLESGKMKLYADDKVLLSMGNKTYNDGKWHHWAINVLRNGNTIVYIDGESVGQMASTNVPALQTGYMYLGAHRVKVEDSSYDMQNKLKGQIDEIRVWNATLNAKVLRDRMNIRLMGNEPGLVAYYPFEKESLDANMQVVSEASAVDVVTNRHQATGYKNSYHEIACTDEAPALKPVLNETNVNYNFVASERGIVIELNEDADRLEGVTVNITVKDVLDLNGNQSLPITWTALVQRNQLLWFENEVDVVGRIGEEKKFTATVTNQSAQTEYWVLSDLPSWLSANFTSGSLPALGNQEITFTVDASAPAGKSEFTVYMSGNNAILVPLTVNMNLKAQAPEWSVDPSDFESSATLFGVVKINVDGKIEYSEDEDDLLAAFIDGQCVGVTNVMYESFSDSYRAYLTIYGNSDFDGKEIELKVWDASTGIVHPVVKAYDDTQANVESKAETLEYEDNAMWGDFDETYLIYATNFIQQSTPLKKNWNWISVYVNNPDTDNEVNGVLESLDSNGASIKSTDQVIEYSDELGWLGDDDLIYNDKMYKLKMTKANTLVANGEQTTITDIEVEKGWNWVPYTRNFPLSVDDAMAGASPVRNDQIKGQDGFAMYNGTAWSGKLTSLEPGKGYLYKSNSAEGTTIKYPAQRNVAPVTEARVMRTLQTSMFSPIDPSEYESNMTVLAIVKDGEEVVKNAQEVAVFNGSVCLAAATVESDGFFYLTIPGDKTLKEKLSVYVVVDGEVIKTSTSLYFAEDATYGNFDNPMVIALGEETSITNILASGNYDKLQVLDLTGRMLYDGAPAGFNEALLGEGVYIFTLFTPEGESVSYKQFVSKTTK